MNVPTSPDAFTSDWLAAALNAPRGSLRGFSAKSIGTGQMSKSFRLALEWDGYDGPASIVAKCPSLDEKTRAIAQALGSYTLEVSWYRQLAGDVGISCPKCLHLESSDDNLDFVLLLEDLAPAKQGDQLAGASIQQIETAIKEAARLHAPFWGNGRAESHPWLAPNETSAMMVRNLTPVFWQQFRERYAQRLGADILEMGDAFIAGMSGYLEPVPSAVTLQHRDFRIDNILFSPANDKAYVVDWQTLGIGAGASDISYLIGTSIADRALRAREERRLVDLYVSELNALGVKADGDVIWREYRLYAFSGVLMAIFASMNVERTERGDEMFAVMAERPAWQALDLDSLSLL
ncbi:MAG TPA: phosphotransferase [Vitreimonas sp.]|nr:phosphotransferase [Vitreimonas sp.]